MALSTNGRISLYCFTLGSCALLIPILAFISLTLQYIVEDFWILLFIVHASSIQGLLYTIYKRRGFAYKIAWRAGLLGSGFSLGVLTFILSSPSWQIFGAYLLFLSAFHYSEYLTTALVNPRTLSLDSFLLNHSKEYGFAAACSCVEFVMERWFCPDLKLVWPISIIGALLCLGGEAMRKGAMVTAGTNFNHIVQSHREEGHVLVTRGIYALCRHPAYVGWFWWSIGTQAILCNPICCLGYAIASWKFFQRRVLEEEITLLNFFGEDYINYQRRVPTGLPFIKGYRLEI